MRSTLLDRMQEYVDFFSGLSSENTDLEGSVRARDQAYHAYMRLPKKSNAKAIKSTSAELAAVIFILLIICCSPICLQLRRTFNWTATLHYGHLNRACRLREIVPLLTMTNFLDTQIQHARNLSELFGNSASTFLQVTQAELQRQLASEEQLIELFNNRVEAIKAQPLATFCPEPWIFTLDDSSNDIVSEPGSHPNRKLLSKAGHLLLRNRVNLVWRWVEVFCYTQSGNLMSQQFDEIGASLLVDLNQKGVYIEETVQDDRRNVFQIVSPTERRTIYLQAESNQERDEWIATLTNIIYDVNNLGTWDAPSRSESKATSPETPRMTSAVNQSDWSVNGMPPVSFDLPAVNQLNSIRDAELIQIHRAAPVSGADSATVSDPSDVSNQPSASSSKPDELVVDAEDIPEPLELGFLGSVQLPRNFQSSDSPHFNDVLSYILSCRSASGLPHPSACRLLITRRDIWLLTCAEDPKCPVGDRKRTNVLARIPFTNFRAWLICTGNARLACLLFDGPLSETPTFASSSGQVCLAFESDYSQLVAERLLAAHLERIDSIADSEDSAEKELLLQAISRLSEAAPLAKPEVPVANRPPSAGSLPSLHE
ncbi:hypothetical protein T265_02940 [Opisthorchis viverrini]|uniref:PH domain-containing protein n=2 Tax=Opisthorchis viverrini TaxID=6198 RepID=A0A074ZXP4_OPIVI|nr:hypothetical protein T265_02940 [Opisthorchis viverrini]KER30702.1 hypothetical protein T265_02940 [Opisthorchis viverrini]